ncbi:MAG: hypothetical protein OXB96_00775 [Candidatus Kaiserbacteria bacterium]|nr:hypothetical protein [Candidatus Kaiserbacteria bacterium]
MGKKIKKVARKKKRGEKPITLGDMKKESGGGWGNYPDDMPVAEWFKEQGMPVAARVFKHLVG